MPKLPSLSPHKLIKILEKNGFILDRSKGSHRIYYNPKTKKRAKGTLHEILKQAGLDREDFRKKR